MKFDVDVVLDHTAGHASKREKKVGVLLQSPSDKVKCFLRSSHAFHGANWVSWIGIEIYELD